MEKQTEIMRKQLDKINDNLELIHENIEKTNEKMDLNKDGCFSVADMVLLQSFVLGKTKTFK